MPKTIKRSHLTSWNNLIPKPRTKKTAIAFLTQHSTHATDQTGSWIQPQTYSLNVKAWHWQWFSDAEKDAWWAAVAEGSPGWEFGLLVDEFQREHDCIVTLTGRSNGWLTLLGSAWQPYGVIGEQKLQEMTASEVKALAHTVWLFDRLADELADDFTSYALNVYGEQPEVEENELDSTDTSV